MTTDAPRDDRPTVTLADRRRAWLARRRWATFVLPLAVYLAVGALEPSPNEQGGWLGIGLAFYPAVYSVKIVLTAAAVWFVWPGLAVFPRRVSAWAALAGVVGAAVWIGLCELPVDRGLAAVGLDRFVSIGARTGYNPFEQLAGATAAWAFLVVRFAGLVVLVPVAEELFLRGFLMRFVSGDPWAEQPIGQLGGAALAASLVYPLATHPAVEWPAAVVWFTMVSLLAAKTRNLCDCVAAHAITNLLLGVYVVAFGAWRLM